MSAKKSKPYEIGGSKYSFNFVGGKLVGAQKANADQIKTDMKTQQLNQHLPNLMIFITKKIRKKVMHNR